MWGVSSKRLGPDVFVVGYFWVSHCVRAPRPPSLQRGALAQATQGRWPCKKSSTRRRRLPRPYLLVIRNCRRMGSRFNLAGFAL